MNSIEILRNHIRRSHPGADLELTRPLRKDGLWSLDVDLEDKHLAIEWSARTGFGFSTSTSDGFGQGPDEVYESFEAARERIDGLLTSVERTAPSFGVLLSRLREQRGLTQQLLAERLGIKQSTLSGVERRDDVQISTVRRIIEALGGALEIFAGFGEFRYRIRIPAASDDPAVRYSIVHERDPHPKPEGSTEVFTALHYTGGLQHANDVGADISARGSVWKH